MTDPLSITAGVLAVGGFALKSSTALHATIRSFRSQNKDARALKTEVGDLTGVLGSLLETVSSNPNLDFKALELPLQRCGNACEEYEKVIAKCTRHSDGSKSSVRDWVTQKYLQGDINDFRTMLAIHKSTINIALANANLSVTVVPKEVLEEYKDMISDTTCDLDTHLQDLQEKIGRLQNGDAAAVNDLAVEWNAMLEEKQSTQQGLRMCAQLSTQIAHYESTSKEHTQFSNRPSAHKHVKSGLDRTRGSIQVLMERLKAHEASIDTQLEAVSSDRTSSEAVAAQLAQLQQTKESISQCIEIVSDANAVADERSNVFEDITLADNSYAFSVSTVNDLVTARRLNLKGRSRHFGGQVADETVQKSMESLTMLDAEHIRSQKLAGHSSHGVKNADASKSNNDLGDFRPFNDRFGPGVSLSVNKTG